ncbi:chorismate lyase [Hoeflea sp. CAU 1731]
MLDNSRRQPIHSENTHAGTDKLEIGEWYDVYDWSLKLAPPKIGPWVTECHSMTKTLEASYEGDVKVDLLSERLDETLPSERKILGENVEEGRIREVILKIRDLPVLTARTVIPVETFDEMQKTFVELGTRPLGNVLFELKDVRRRTAEIAALDFDYPLLASVRERCNFSESDIPFWGRRNLFSLSGLPLLLTEIFLPPSFAEGADIPDPVIREEFRRPIPLQRD